MSKWKKLDSRCFGITSSMIPRHALSVLNVLRHAGSILFLGQYAHVSLSQNCLMLATLLGRIA